MLCLLFCHPFGAGYLISFTRGFTPIGVKLSSFAGGRANFVCQCLHTVYNAYQGCVAPTGLKQ